MWGELIGWTAAGIIVPTLVGIAVGLMSVTPPEVQFAKLCFTLAAAILLARCAASLVIADMYLWSRLLLGALVFGGTGVAWVEAWRWVEVKAEIIRVPIIVAPSTVRLHSGQWQHRTPVRVTNRSDRDLFAVLIKIRLETPGITPESILLEMDGGTASPVASVGPIAFSSDLVIHVTYPDGKRGLYLRYHTLSARVTREFIIAGATAVESSASISVVAFKDKTQPILEAGKKVAVSFEVPEIVTLEGFRVFRRP